MRFNKGKLLIATYSDVEQALGFSHRTAERLKKSGVLVLYKSEVRDIEFDFIASIQSYFKYVQDINDKKSKASSREELEQEKLKADIALKGTQLELNTLKTDIQNGKYVLRDNVRQAYARFFVEFKKMAMGLPGRMAIFLSGQIEPAQVRVIEQDVARDISEVLRAFTAEAVLED